MNKTIPKAYKQSTADTIPEGWEVVKLGDIADIVMGQSPSSNSYNENNIGIPLIQGNADCKDRLTIPRMYTTEKTKICSIGDIIMTVRAPVGAISKSMHNACIGRGVCAITANYKNKFLYHYLIYYENKWETYSQGTTFTAVNSDDIKNLKIKFPPKKEQQKIAEILTTWDKAIDTQQKLISTHQQLKKGLMQQLLTGKTRFPEFSSKWQEVKLGDISVKKTSNIALNKIINNNGIYPIYGAIGLLKHINFYTEEDSYIAILKDGAGVGRILYCPSQTSVLGTMDIVRAKNNITLKFLYSLLKTIDFSRYIVGSGIPHIYYKDYRIEQVKIPCSKAEQQKIAKVLNLADDEITQRQKELEQLKQQKKALMQQLLTGKVRVKV